jgi:uroporphyrinogen-III decarboxylase
MLTKRQNLLETIHGGHPDRYVNQFEAFHIIETDPFNMTDPYPEYGQHNVKNGWGITLSWPIGTPGAFPVHDEEHIVCKDITNWRDVVKAPDIIFPAELWAPTIAEAEAVDRSEEFVTVFTAPGIFERCHYLLSIEEALIDFYEEPEALKELIDYLTEWELAYAAELCKYVKPDAVFHHDDWGSQLSTFISPEMFEEFIVPSYKKIYGFYKSHGVEVIVHHSDSYGATLVPYMIDMGIDIWQGVMTTNNIPELIEKYGGQITFMGGMNSATVDHPGWQKEEVVKEVERACKEYGTRFYIPNLTQGGPYSTFEGVYEATSEEIEKMSRQMFK